MYKTLPRQYKPSLPTITSKHVRSELNSQFMKAYEAVFFSHLSKVVSHNTINLLGQQHDNQPPKGIWIPSIYPQKSLPNSTWLSQRSARTHQSPKKHHKKKKPNLENEPSHQLKKLLQAKNTLHCRSSSGPSAHNSDLTVHNLSSLPLEEHDLAMLSKGLSFSPLPKTPVISQQLDLLKQFNKYTRSLRPIYVHATHKPPIKTPTPCNPINAQKHHLYTDLCASYPSKPTHRTYKINVF